MYLNSVTDFLKVNKYNKTHQLSTHTCTHRRLEKGMGGYTPTCEQQISLKVTARLQREGEGG